MPSFIYGLLRLLGRWAIRLVIGLILNRLRAGTPDHHRRTYRREVRRWLGQVDLHLILRSLREEPQDRRRAIRILRLIHHQALVAALPEHLDEPNVAHPYPPAFSPVHQADELRRWLEPLGVSVDEVGPVVPDKGD